MQQMAQGLASLGRGQDSMLVHMTPGEVHGLQSLAQQHGGSLTINPQTGLPEAGFLSSILPIAAGFMLGPAGFGVMSSAMAGLTVGGLTALATGDLKQGLMSGMGAYGGAGIGEALVGAAPTTPVGNWEAGMGAYPTAAPPPIPVTPSASLADAATSATGVRPEVMAQFGTQTPNGITLSGASQYGTPSMFSGTSVSGVNALANPVLDVVPTMSTPITPGSTDFVGGFGNDARQLAAVPVAAPVAAPVATPTFSGIPDDYSGRVPFSASAPTPSQFFNNKLSAGFDEAIKKPMDFIKANKGVVASTAIPLGLAGIQAMSAQPTLPASMAKPAVPTMFDNRQYSPGTRNPNFGQPGQPYFLGQGYTPSALSTAYAAAGGSMQDIQANSQPVMPPNQMIGGATPNENQFYPGANIARGGASVTPQAPSATEVVGGYDQNINQYTGEPVRMAGGGITYNQGDQTYSGEVQPYGSTYGSANLSDLFASTGFPKPLNFALDEIGRGMLPQIRQQAAPQYDYNPDNQQYTLRMAKGGKAKALDTEINTDEPSERDIYENTDDDAIAKLQKILGRSIAEKSMAGGGIASLNEYAAGGRLLQGPGDGMSDSIPAVIKGARPQRAALAQGEFVIPADVVSHLGNGSTDAGSKRLYAMMDKIRHARTGSKKQGRQINPDKFMIA
jgi:hypothetical protein